MFVPDPAAAVREMRRVLASDGQLLLNTWDRLEQNDFCNVAHRTQSTCFDRDPPTFYEIPFRLHDADLLQHWMQGAGLRSAVVRRVDLRSVSPSAADAAKGLVQGTPLAAAIKERNGDLHAITDTVAAALRAEFGDNPLRGRMCALVCEGAR